jgi:hormone-sensitive lipase
MSASSHENYTRKWTNTLQIPVFSIDYRLSPEFPYPKSLDDVYQAYMWIINFGEEIFKNKITNIILVGDSAGGNLVMSLTYLLIMMGQKLPTALMLAYPALCVSESHMCSSYLNVLNDIILPYHLLKFCLDSYRNDYMNEADPFLSPIIMSDNILKKLPPVRIFCGSTDPLRDDSIHLLYRLMYI